MCPHYKDNQGFCHQCGKPMDSYWFFLYCNPYRGDSPAKEDAVMWNSLVISWNARHPQDPADMYFAKKSAKVA